MQKKPANISKAKVTRFKVLNLLYLVFLAITFVYTPNQFLNSTKDTARDFYNYSSDINSIRSGRVSAVKLSNTSNSTQQLNQIGFEADGLCNFIDELIGECLKQSNVTSMYELNNSQLSNYVISETYMKKGTATELKNKLAAYKNKVSVFGVDTTSLNSLVPSSDLITDINGNEQKWEKYFFYRTPVGVLIATFEEMKTNVRQIQYITANHILNQPSKKRGEAQEEDAARQKELAALTDTSKYSLIKQIQTYRKPQPKAAMRGKDKKNDTDKASKKGNSKTPQAKKPLDQKQLAQKVTTQAQKQTSLVSALKELLIRKGQSKSANKNKQEKLTVTSRLITYTGDLYPVLVRQDNYRYDISKQSLKTRFKGDTLAVMGNHAGEASLKVDVYDKANNQLVRTHKIDFVVYDKPMPEVKLDYSNAASQSMESLIRNRSLTFEGSGSKFKLDRYQLKLINENGTETVMNYGNKFMAKTKSLLASAGKGDVIIFNDIQCITNEGSYVKLSPIIIEVR